MHIHVDSTVDNMIMHYIMSYNYIIIMSDIITVATRSKTEKNIADTIC